MSLFPKKGRRTVSVCVKDYYQDIRPESVGIVVSIPPIGKSEDGVSPSHIFSSPVSSKSLAMGGSCLETT